MNEQQYNELIKDKIAAIAALWPLGHPDAMRAHRSACATIGQKTNLAETRAFDGDTALENRGIKPSYEEGNDDGFYEGGRF